MHYYIDLHINFGWLCMLGGAISGAFLGHWFHLENFAGGYQDFRRRLLRLGHISFFGLGLLNLCFAFSLPILELELLPLRAASTGFFISAVTMPLCCFLTAWNAELRRLFPIPVISLFISILALLVS